MRTIRLGLLLMAVVSGVIGLVFGPGAIAAAAGMGLVAIAIQVAATTALRRAAGQPYAVFLKQYAIGMGLRMVGVTVMAVVIVVRPDLFSPLPTAFGFLGVLVPLLFLEARLIR
jgi:hypothetical protein